MTLPRVPVVLHGDGLVLDAPGPGDLDRIVEACRSPDARELLGSPWPYERQHAAFFAGPYWAGSWAAGTAQVFAIREAPGAPILGTIELRHAEAPHPVTGTATDVGFHVYPDARGRGIATRALRLLAAWGFAHGVRRIGWEAIAGNRASATVARRCGFTFDGTGPSIVCSGRHLGRPAWFAHLDRGDDPAIDRAGWPGPDAPTAAPLPRG